MTLAVKIATFTKMRTQASTAFSPDAPMAEITAGPTLNLNGLMRLEEIPRLIKIVVRVSAPVKLGPMPPVELGWRRRLWVVLNMDVRDVWRDLIAWWRRS